MFTKFDKAFAGGFAAWLTAGAVALMEGVGLPPVDGATETWLATVVALGVVWLVPNKT